MKTYILYRVSTKNSCFGFVVDSDSKKVIRGAPMAMRSINFNKGDYEKSLLYWKRKWNAEIEISILRSLE